MLLNISSYSKTNEGLHLRKRLRNTLAETSANGSDRVHTAFDIVGDIAIIKMPSHSTVNPETAAETMMERHKNIKAVFLQKTAVRGDFRLRGLLHLAGEDNSCTVHKELGCSFKVDLKKCYFSPRLLGERLRIAQLVTPRETIINMFAGVGCFSLVIAKNVASTKVYSIDVNPAAVQFMTENIRLNRVYGKVIPLQGDSKTIIKKQLERCADRVLMPLPEKAFEYLPSAVSALRSSGGWIHVHVFEHATKTESSTEKVKRKVGEALMATGVSFGVQFVRVVRSTGPNWWHLVADVEIKC